MNVIRHTITKNGLKIQPAMAAFTYQAGIVAKSAELATLNIVRPDN